jgi:hypothetical protein
MIEWDLGYYIPYRTNIKREYAIISIIGALIFFTILLVISIGFSVRMNKINHNKTDLIRDAKVEDIEFIFKNILEGSRNGYFHPDLYNVENAKMGLQENIRTIIEENYRLDSNRPDSWAFIYEKRTTYFSAHFSKHKLRV